jgi:hypothetical protein
MEEKFIMERGHQTFDFSLESHHFTFSHGASLRDSDNLFNAASKATRGERAIFLRDKINQHALKISSVPPLITIRSN